MMGWILAWFLVFMLLYVLSRTRSGHSVIYYATWLAVVLLLVTHSDQIVGMLKKGGFAT